MRSPSPSKPAPEGRARALAVLARCRPDLAAELIPDLLAPEQPVEVQSAAARAIADVGSGDVVADVLGLWGSLPTPIRREVLAAMLSSTPLISELLDAIEDDTIALAELEPTDRDALRLTPDPALRKRVEALLAKSAPPDRGDVLRQFQSALTLPADPRRGAELFAKNCQTCHQHQGKGLRVGPDLSGRRRSPPLDAPEGHPRPQRGRLARLHQLPRRDQAGPGPLRPARRGDRRRA